MTTALDRVLRPQLVGLVTLGSLACWAALTPPSAYG